MSRIEALNQRYAAAASLVRNGVEIIAVGDPIGSRLNAAVRRLQLAAQEDGPGLWDDLIGAAKALRWRLVAQPMPVKFNVALREGAAQVAREIQRGRGAVANDALLDELAAASLAVSEFDPPLGAVFLSSIEEVGPSKCVVVAGSKPAQIALGAWLGELGVRVLTVGGLRGELRRAEQTYVVGPPRFFPSALVTAPVTESLSFLLPAWFRDRSIPRSVLAPYAEGAIQVQARIFTEGDLSEPEHGVTATEIEDDFLPQPVWEGRQSPDREPTSEEVKARKVLLSGNMAMWLDDGDRIRALDPNQPVGERVIYIDVAAVQTGTYLLLRKGATERQALYQAALHVLGTQGVMAHATQRAWKGELTKRLMRQGYREVVRTLHSRGVKSADRARAWAEPNLVRPHSDHDFEVLLRWLGIPVQSTVRNANMVRRALYQASADLREQLETAVSAADLSVLQNVGHLSLDVQAAGFRGIMATRVLAISPYTEIVRRYDGRVPFEDWSAQWLE